ncbi:MAG: class I SAM-dependent methyltransferase, partial [Candidatus Hodarchaeota archaeon]
MVEDSKKTYHKSAQYYDLLYQWKNYEKEVNDFLHLSKETLGRPLTSLLDLGCGTGNHVIHFARKGISVVGVDLSEEELEIARKKTAKEGLTIDFIL